MHEEPRLNEGESLAQTHSRILRDNNRRNIGVLALVPIDPVTYSGIAWCLSLLGLRLRCLQLLVLYQLLEVAGRQSFHMIYYDIVWRGKGIFLDDSPDILVPPVVTLLLLDAIAEVV